MEDNTKQQIQEALNLLSKERVNTAGLGAPINILKRLLEDSEKEPYTEPSTEPITAQSFFNTHWNLGKSIDEIMVLFAKYHRERMIEAIALHGDVKWNGTVDMESIANAYAEDKII